MDYKDDATALTARKRERLSERCDQQPYDKLYFQVLEKEGVPTHFVEELSDRETAVKKVEIVPLEVIVRNVAAGRFFQETGY